MRKGADSCRCSVKCECALELGGGEEAVAGTRCGNWEEILKDMGGDFELGGGEESVAGARSGVSVAGARSGVWGEILKNMARFNWEEVRNP